MSSFPEGFSLHDRCATAWAAQVKDEVSRPDPAPTCATGRRVCARALSRDDPPHVDALAVGGEAAPPDAILPRIGDLSLAALQCQ